MNHYDTFFYFIYLFVLDPRKWGKQKGGGGNVGQSTLYEKIHIY